MKWAVLIAVVVAGDALLSLFAFRLAVRRGWSRLAERYPARPAAGDAVTRSGQSFRVGLMPFIRGVHVTVDDDHLHLSPARPFAMLGALPISLPWDQVLPTDASPRRGAIRATVDEIDLVGPTWCLELADPRERTSTF